MFRNTYDRMENFIRERKISLKSQIGILTLKMPLKKGTTYHLPLSLNQSSPIFNVEYFLIYFLFFKWSFLLFFMKKIKYYLIYFNIDSSVLSILDLWNFILLWKKIKKFTWYDWTYSWEVFSLKMIFNILGMNINTCKSLLLKKRQFSFVQLCILLFLNS